MHKLLLRNVSDMTNLWELYKNGTWVEPFLSLSIDLFVGASFLLYLLIIWSRYKNIKKEKLQKQYSIVIEKAIFSIIFQDISFSEIQQDKEYAALAKNSFFREVLTETLINLHKNYEGAYAQKLEEFYQQAGLMDKSLKKLKNLKWEIKCKGISELAEMNVTEAFEGILNVSKSRNKTLKITALNACIKLAGVKGITHLSSHPFPIDEWTQVNIIHAFKKHDIGDTKGVELLLHSQNTTIVSLGLKIIKELRLTQKASYVADLAVAPPNALIQYEAQNVLKELTAQTI
ncbi:hypothetical protein [Flavobacterium sp. Root901]|uniref:hypothetical protein n=1 Tax=Flavobacterium sp. Root901 TaxID=1736605 RepID=UPI001F587565|nr:hypothetical protein [Flavobacterium sp. Root901]